MNHLSRKAWRRLARIYRQSSYLLRTPHPSPHHAHTHYTTGYWEIKSSIKNPVAHYHNLARLSLELIKGGYVTVYTDSAWFAEIARNTLPTDRLEVFELGLDELPARRKAGQLLAAWKKQQSDHIIHNYHSSGTQLGKEILRKEKGLVHYTRDLVGSGEAVAHNLLSIWLSKLDLTLASHRRGIFPCKWIAWADASLSRCNYTRNSWDIRCLQPQASQMLHYPSKMYYKAERLSIRAGFLLAEPDIMELINHELQAEIDDAVKDPYCHDEETLLHLVKRREPSRFHAIK